MTVQYFQSAEPQQYTVQGFLGIPLNTFREASAFDVGNIAANGGILASDSTPILDAINGATDGCQRLLWAASNNDQVVTSLPVPPDLDYNQPLVLHTRIVSGGTTNPVGFTVDTFFNEGDTKVTDTSQTNQTATYGEKTTTIAAADIPSGAQVITIGLTPVAHTTDSMALTAAWLEYTKLSINLVDLYACQVAVPFTHKIIGATLYSQNVVTTGTVTVTLRQRDKGDSRGGAAMGTALNNTTLIPPAVLTNAKYDFVLTSDDKAVAPANRIYFVVFTGTDAGDRVEEALLVLKVEDDV